MRGALAKRIHSLQESDASLTWPKARKLWNELMGIDTTGHQTQAPIDDSRYQQAKASRKRNRRFASSALGRLSHNRSEGHPTVQCVSVRRSWSHMKRPGPYTKIAERHIRRAMREQYAARLALQNKKGFLSSLADRLFGRKKAA